jgi:hypothetical protein
MNNQLEKLQQKPNVRPFRPVTIQINKKNRLNTELAKDDAKDRIITQKIVDQHIIEYTERYEYQYPVNDKDDSVGEALSTLKSIKRHLLIKKII